MAAALKETPRQKVTVNVAIIYSGNNMRPEKFSVKYTVDGEAFSEVIKN
ncbi:DNA/RNA non-specific endonuclease [Bacillus cereus group sp. BfR-BA-01380]|nr:DNA/RNA non-specific endonuclease [Bacillus cereus group sp. BfR-BA-01380]